MNDPLNCEHCLTFSPFIYARCLNRVLHKKYPAVCELGIKKKRINKGIDGLSLVDILELLLTQRAMTVVELDEAIPEYKVQSIRTTLSNVPQISKHKIKGQRARVFQWNT